LSSLRERTRSYNSIVFLLSRASSSSIIPLRLGSSWRSHLPVKNAAKPQNCQTNPYPINTEKLKCKKIIPFHGDFLSNKGNGTKENPWILKTPPGTSEYKAFRDETANPPAIVVWVGKTELKYYLRSLDDLHKMLKTKGDWMPLGSADEQKTAEEGTVEAWARSSSNPVGGWYGLKKGLRGRFANYIPPLMEVLGLAEVEHNPRNNRMRAK